MVSTADRTAYFADLHRRGRPLLLANAWDPGSARLLVTLGFAAVATTSSGFAATLGRLDGGAGRDEVLEHVRAVVGAVDVPVSADFERGFADSPEEVAANVVLAAETGLAGCSIEDFTGNDADPIYDRGLAVERMAAAVEAAHGGPHRLVVTARAENHIHGRDDLDDTVRRLAAYAEAGADVVFAPGVVAPDRVRRLVTEVDRPVNVLALPGAPSVAELAELGVARISVGGGLAFAALDAAATVARRLLDDGAYDWFDAMSRARKLTRLAFTPPR